MARVRHRLLASSAALALVLAGCFLFPSLDEYGRCVDAPCTADGAPDAPPADVTSAPDAPSADAACSDHVDTDSAHCGRCGHDCLGGSCKGGTCQPAPFVEALPGADLLAGSADRLFVGTRSSSGPSLYIAEKATPGRFEAYASSAGRGGVRDLAWDGTRGTLAAGDGAIYTFSSAADGGLPRVFAAPVVDGSAGDLDAFEQTSDALYARSRARKLVYRVTDGGTTAIDLATFTAPSDMTSVGAAFFMAENTTPPGIWTHAAADAGALVRYGDLGGQAPNILYRDGSQLYWASYKSFNMGRVDTTSADAHDIRLAAPLVEGARAFDAASEPIGFAFSKDHVYVALRRGAGTGLDRGLHCILRFAKSDVRRYAPDASTTETPATVVAVLESAPSSLHSDGVALYWTEPERNRVMRLAY